MINVLSKKRVFGQRFGFINLLKPLFIHRLVDLFKKQNHIGYLKFWKPVFCFICCCVAAQILLARKSSVN